MTNEVTKAVHNDVAELKNNWSEEDRQLIHQTVAKGTTASELKLFLYTAGKYDLDPLVKQIWCVKYGSQPAAIFTGRDGFLSIAHKSGVFNGMKSEAIFDDDNKLTGGKCIVHRKDMEFPFEEEVLLSEYNTGRSNWAKMPATMIKKVAESQCLRKAFDISGLYSPEENWMKTDAEAPTTAAPIKKRRTKAEMEADKVKAAEKKAMDEAVKIEQTKREAKPKVEVIANPDNIPKVEVATIIEDVSDAIPDVNKNTTTKNVAPVNKKVSIGEMAEVVQNTILSRITEAQKKDFAKAYGFASKMPKQVANITMYYNNPEQLSTDLDAFEKTLTPVQTEEVSNSIDDLFGE